MASIPSHDSSNIAPITSLAPAGMGATSGIPVALTPLVGRATELAELIALLQSPDVRLVTLTGPGGVGKTRLAIEAASQLTADLGDRVTFVALAAVRDPDLVDDTIALALDLQDLSGRTLPELIAAALRGAPALLVLDNMEHLLPAAPLLTDLLATCPELTVLTTSRGRLRLSGERDMPLAPLSVPDLGAPVDLARLPDYGAIRLWTDRAQAANPAFALTSANAQTVAAICQKLDGLPLAIELAAAWSRVLAPDAVLARLERRLHLLTDGPRDAPTRLQTMRAAVAWSYDLLNPAEQALCRRLAIFTGGCTIEGADAVWAAPFSDTAQEVAPAEIGATPVGLLDLAGALLDKALLRPTTNAEGEPRLAMLETIREYGLEQVAVSGENDLVRDTHAAFYLHWVEASAPGLEGPEHVAWYHRIEAELGNIRSALTWLVEHDRSEEALRLCGALAWFWTVPNHLSEGRAWFDRLLHDPAGVAPAVRARALGANGDLADWQGNDTLATTLHQEALDLWREVGDRRQVAATLRSLGSAAIDRMDFSEAESVLTEALRLAQETGDDWNTSAAANLLGTALRFRGLWREAIPLSEQTVQISRKLDDQARVLAGLNSLGWAWLDGGDHARAWESFDAALSLEASDIDEDSAGIASCLEGFGALAGEIGSQTIGIRLIAAAAAIRNRIGIQMRRPMQVSQDRRIATWEATIGTPAVAAAWNAGRSLDRDGANALARSVPRPASQAAVAADSGLSPRELDVLALLVEGASDQDIADGLFISRKTASNHVAAILEKLGAGNRTAAATLAVRKGFV